MVPPLQLGLGLGLPRVAGVLDAFLLNQDLTQAAQYQSGGWLFENHSRDTGATVVDENGNVVWAPENLLDGSEGPTVYWARTGVTHVLTGATYEGRVVHQLTKTSAAGVNGYVMDHGQGGTLSENSRLYLSAKFEKTESPLIASIYFTNQGVASYYVELDVSDGTIIGTNGTGGNHEVIDDGDWWLIRTPVENSGGTGSDFFSIRIDPDEDAGAVLRFTQPMVSRGGFHEYIPSSGGNPTFTPRLQHDSAGNPLGYLHEPQATNSITDDYDHLNDPGMLITTSAEPSPIAGRSPQEPDYQGGEPEYWNILIQSGEVYSFYFKSDGGAGDINTIQILESTTSAGVSFFHDGSTVTPNEEGAGLSEITDYGVEPAAFGNGWYRCWIKSGSTTSLYGVLGDYIGSNYPTVGATCLLAGFQLEDDRLTSYIPTFGAAATRQADDVAPILIPGLLDTETWSALVSFRPADLQDRQSCFLVYSSADAFSNGIGVDFSRNASLHYWTNSNDPEQANLDVSFSRNGDASLMKQAVVYTADRRYYVSNEIDDTVDTRQGTGSATRTLDTVEIGRSLNGVLVSVVLTPKVWSDEKAAALTAP